MNLLIQKEATPTGLVLKAVALHNLTMVQGLILKAKAAHDSGIWTDCGSEGCCQGQSATHS